MMLSFEAASVRGPPALGTGSIRAFCLDVSPVRMWERGVLSNQNSNVAPQTLQEAWPVCGTKNLISVRSYSAPQSHWTIVAISKYAPSASRFKPDVRRNQK